MRLSRQVLLAGIVLAAILLNGCTTQLRGSVVSKTTGNPVSGAKVSVGDKSAVTAKDGTFVLEGVPLGKIRVAVEASGYPRMSLDLQVSSDAKPLTVRLEDASLAGHVVEAAVEPKVPAGASVRAGAASATVDAAGSFSMSGLPVGKVSVTVADPSHETTTLVLNLMGGSNVCTAVMSLTATETYTRYHVADKFGRYAVAYEYVHPDVRALQPFATYSKNMQSGGTVLSMTLGDARLLTEWRSPYTTKTYSNVVETDRTIVFEWAGTKITDNTAQHWVKVDGKWLMVFARE
jgi:hypothetical protein